MQFMSIRLIEISLKHNRLSRIEANSFFAAAFLSVERCSLSKQLDGRPIGEHHERHWRNFQAHFQTSQ